MTDRDRILMGEGEWSRYIRESSQDHGYRSVYGGGHVGDRPAIPPGPDLDSLRTTKREFAKESAGLLLPPIILGSVAGMAIKAVIWWLG